MKKHPYGFKYQNLIKKVCKLTVNKLLKIETKLKFIL